MMKIIGVGKKPKNKVTMYLIIKDLATKMERKLIITKGRNTPKRVANRKEEDQREKATINIDRTEWYFFWKDIVLCMYKIVFLTCNELTRPLLFLFVGCV